MPTFLQQAAAAQAATGLSGRRLCRRVSFGRATFCRWRHRQQCGQPFCRTPGPPKTGPLPLAQVRAQIRQLPHGPCRTQGTGALYQQHRDGISRRQFSTLVADERQRKQRERRNHLQLICWHDAQTAWAMDSTEWPTSQPGVKLQVLVARDLASQFSLGGQVDTHLYGGQVAAFVAKIIRQHGAPLCLKRDNGAVLHTPEVEQVLAQAGVLSLDSPAYYPQYNGGMEKQIGDLKRLYPFALPIPSGFPFPLPGLADDLGFAKSILAGLVVEFNARPRPGFLDCSRAEMFYAGPRHTADRPTRAAIFASLFAEAWRSLDHMKFPDQRTFAAAWRQAVVVWLRRQSLISVTEPQQTDTNKQLLLPLFSEKWSH
jgi:transposase InsO family protein